MNTDRSLTAKNLSPAPAGGKRPVVMCIVLHDTAGSGTLADAQYLAHDPEHRKISVDFCVLRDGTVMQLNPDPTRHYTYHAGRHTKFRGLINGAVNQHSIGIEISHNADPARQTPEWPSIQVNAVAQLCKGLCAQFGLTANDITTHAKIITDGSRTDPRNFPFALFWATFNGDTELATVQSAVTEQPAPTTSTGPMGTPIGTYYTVKEGDNLWKLAQVFSTSIESIKGLNNLTDENLITVGQNLRVK